MIDVIVTGVVGLLSTIIGSIASWLTAKKKYNAEVDSTIIENIQKSLDFYIRLADDNQRRLEDVLKRNEYLEKRDADIEKKNDKLEEEITRLRNQMFTLMQQICLDFTCNRRIKNAELFGPIKTPKNNQ